jgi:hypothetical protein
MNSICPSGSCRQRSTIFWYPFCEISAIIVRASCRAASSGSVNVSRTTSSFSILRRSFRRWNRSAICCGRSMTSLTGCVAIACARRDRPNSGAVCFTSLDLSFDILPLTIMNGCRQIIVSPKIFHSVFSTAKRRPFSTWNRHADGGHDRSALNAVPENKRHRGATPDSKIVSNCSLLIFSDRAHTSHGLFELQLLFMVLEFAMTVPVDGPWAPALREQHK